MEQSCILAGYEGETELDFPKKISKDLAHTQSKSMQSPLSSDVPENMDQTIRERKKVEKLWVEMDSRKKKASITEKLKALKQDQLTPYEESKNMKGDKDNKEETVPEIKAEYS
eukprot:snap_masked-scaffold_25-processed-gene-5.29-mRNA-1 protein AED:1.00 eAED:1.00 QI:0/0/0/0/1/1/2/0/112